MRINIVYSHLVALASFLLCSCQTNNDPLDSTTTPITDAQLYTLSTGLGPWQFYKYSSDTLMKGAGSGHDESRLRTRYNAKAATQLDANGKVLNDAHFPDSSLIVKELYTGSVITTYSVMMKHHGDKNTAPNDWVWAEYDGKGAVKQSVTTQGSGCSSCHSSGIDYTRMNGSHP